MSSRSNHDVKNVLFFRIHNILPCEHTTLCLSILLLTDIQVVSITWLLLTVVATRNMRGQVCLWDPESNSFGCTWVWNCWIIGSFLFFFFFEESSYCFPVTTPVYILMLLLLSLTPLPVEGISNYGDLPLSCEWEKMPRGWYSLPLGPQLFMVWSPRSGLLQNSDFVPIYNKTIQLSNTSCVLSALDHPEHCPPWKTGLAGRETALTLRAHPFLSAWTQGLRSLLNVYILH